VRQKEKVSLKIPDLIFNHNLCLAKVALHRKFSPPAAALTGELPTQWLNHFSRRDHLGWIALACKPEIKP
jgi:hypothetical protein